MNLEFFYRAILVKGLFIHSFVFEVLYTFFKRHTMDIRKVVWSFSAINPVQNRFLLNWFFVVRFVFSSAEFLKKSYLVQIQLDLQHIPNFIYYIFCFRDAVCRQYLCWDELLPLKSLNDERPRTNTWTFIVERFFYSGTNKERLIYVFQVL